MAVQLFAMLFNELINVALKVDDGGVCLGFVELSVCRLVKEVVLESPLDVDGALEDHGTQVLVTPERDEVWCVP